MSILLQQVLQDLHDIWNSILMEKLHIPPAERNLYSAVLVLPETFDNRGMFMIFFIFYYCQGFVIFLTRKAPLCYFM